MNKYNGYLYCIGHPCMVNIYKIGFTKRTVEERLLEANRGDTYKLPGYEIVYKKKVRDVAKKETLVKKILDKHAKKIHPNREFYRVDFTLIKSLFDLIDGKNENVYTTIKTESNEEIIKKIEHIEKRKIDEHKCEKCNLTFKSKHFLAAHYKTKRHLGFNHVIHKCDKCDYSTKQMSSYKIHILNNHSTKEERKKGFNYYCECCDIGKMDEKAFENHLTTKKHKLISKS